MKNFVLTALIISSSSVMATSPSDGEAVQFMTRVRALTDALMTIHGTAEFREFRAALLAFVQATADPTDEARFVEPGRRVTRALIALPEVYPLIEDPDFERYITESHRELFAMYVDELPHLNQRAWSPAFLARQIASLFTEEHAKLVRDRSRPLRRADFAVRLADAFHARCQLSLDGSPPAATPEQP